MTVNTVNIKDCDLNHDYYHFTNKANINGILNNGLIPSVGAASKLVNDRPNVSISQGGKGIMGIINSFIFKFSNELKISEIPEEFRKYFLEIKDFNSNAPIDRDIACKAIMRKLKDEVYFRVRLSPEQLEKAKIGGLTEFDINLPEGIDKNNVDLIIDSNNKVLSACDVAKYIYEKAKDIDVFRKCHSGFFYMFEMEKQSEIDTQNNERDDDER